MSIAVSIAAASAVSAARSADTPLPEPDLQIAPCAVVSLTVDGLPVLKHGYCRWENGRWWPLDLPPEITIGIEPKED